jgi:carbon storage regulator CsrA
LSKGQRLHATFASSTFVLLPTRLCEPLALRPVGAPLPGRRIVGARHFRFALGGTLSMLVLARRMNEKLLFPGLDIAVQVVGIKPGLVRLGIEAPDRVRVLRAEVPDREAEWGRPAEKENETGLDLERLNQLLYRRLEIARRGLNHARQLAGEKPEDASVLLEKVNEDLYMLQRRMKSEVAKVAARPQEQETDEFAFAAACRQPR